MISQESEIEDLDAYIGRMDKSIMDKLFFVDKVGDPGLFVDYGCADGTLLKMLRNWFGGADMMGYDISEKMVKRVENIDDELQIMGTSDFGVVEATMGTEAENSVLILSSIIHEIYHYSEPAEIEEFWDRVWNTGFDYVVIRDMVPSRSLDRQPSMNDVRKVYSEFGGTEELQDFETYFGSVDKSQENLVQFLLKYRYTEPNWEREVREDYFPFYFSEFLGSVPSDYDILFNHHYVLPYLKQEIRNDFGIELEDPTHAKFILER